MSGCDSIHLCRRDVNLVLSKTFLKQSFWKVDKLQLDVVVSCHMHTTVDFDHEVLPNHDVWHVTIYTQHPLHSMRLPLYVNKTGLYDMK